MMACGGVWSSLAEGGPGGVQKEIPIRHAAGKLGDLGHGHAVFPAPPDDDLAPVHRHTPATDRELNPIPVARGRTLSSLKSASSPPRRGERHRGAITTILHSSPALAMVSCEPGLVHWLLGIG